MKKIERKFKRRQIYLGAMTTVAFVFLSFIDCKEEERGPLTDGEEDLELLAGEDAMELLIDVDNSDWSACEVIEDYCLPSDTTIFITNCTPDESGNIHFDSRFQCFGYCMCGFVSWNIACDDWRFECTDLTAYPYQHVYCSTGKRILCSHEVGTRAIVRVGCCDEADYVYCERDPRPDSNLCQ